MLIDYADAAPRHDYARDAAAIDDAACRRHVATYLFRCHATLTRIQAAPPCQKIAA